MRLDSLIKAMQTVYPGLFPTRLRALDQIFLVNGNGYEWQPDGTIAYPDAEGDLDDTTALARKIEAGEVDDADLALLRELSLQDHAARMVATMKETYDRMRAEAKAEGEDISGLEPGESETAAYWLAKEKADIAKAHEKATRGWWEPYPICEYAKCSNVPDNVQQDHLEGCIEVLSCVSAMEPVYHGECANEEMLVHFHARKAETVTEAGRLLAELRQRFASRLP